jgi:hypothetical protein
LFRLIGNPSPTFPLKRGKNFPSVWELAKVNFVVDLAKELSHTTICVRRSGLSTLSLKETKTNEEKWTEYLEFEGDKDE